LEEAAALKPGAVVAQANVLEENANQVVARFCAEEGIQQARSVEAAIDVLKLGR